MVKHTQTIRRQTADELLSLFDHFVILAPKELICIHDHDKNIEENVAGINCREGNLAIFATFFSCGN